MKYSYENIDRYMKDITVQADGLGVDQEQKLSKIIRHSNNQKNKDKAINEFVEANLGLVLKCAKDVAAVSRSGLSLMDLITEGNYWLFRAVLNFRYKKGCRFSTYAYPIIKHHLWQLIQVNRIIHIPSNVMEYRKKFRELQYEYKGVITKEIIMKEFDVVADRAESIDGAFRLLNVTSLDNPIGDENDATLGDIIEDESAPNPAIEADKNILQEYLDKVGDACLEQREKEIVNLLYVDYHHYTLEEVASKMKITKERIRQIACRAIRKMRIKVIAEWDSRHQEDIINNKAIYREINGHDVEDRYHYNYQERQGKDLEFSRRIEELNRKKQQKIRSNLA